MSTFVPALMTSLSRPTVCGCTRRQLDQLPPLLHFSSISGKESTIRHFMDKQPCQSACLPACLLARLSAILPACLPACLCACPSAYASPSGPLGLDRPVGPGMKINCFPGNLRPPDLMIGNCLSRHRDHSEIIEGKFWTQSRLLKRRSLSGFAIKKCEHSHLACSPRMRPLPSCFSREQC